LVIAMTKMIKTATCTQLQKLPQARLKETSSYARTLEKKKIFRSFGDECSAIDFCSEGKEGKEGKEATTWNGRRGVCPIVDGSSRPVPRPR
jgi:hypothetical protein